MNVFQAIILGIVEGVTEFIPVSSTFHLIFTSKILGIAQNDFTKLFEVFIQSGAILSVVFLYLNTIKDRNLVFKVLLSFMPTAIVGFVMYKIIKSFFFENYGLMIIVFMTVGVLFIGIEYFIRKNKTKLSLSLRQLNPYQVLLIGLIQALAVMPGVSRSGAVIIGMMFLGVKRDEAAKFSFLLAVPTIFMASAYDLYKMRSVVVGYADNVLLLIVGFISAFISSYFVIKWFIDFLKKKTLTVFGIYRLTVGIILLLGKIT